jgi:hypothetical protein
MLILLQQRKQLSQTSKVDIEGVDTFQQVRFSRQVENDRQEIKIEFPFMLIVVDIAKLMTRMY